MLKNCFAVALCIFLALVVPATASASPFTVGQTATSATPPIDCAFADPADELQLGVAVHPAYFVAAQTGTIISWSTFAGSTPGQSFTFKVFRKAAPGFTFLVAARDTRSLTPGVLNTFPVAIPVQQGDFIGEGQPGGVHSPCQFETGQEADRILVAEGDHPQGSTFSFPGIGENGARLNVSATVLPPPTITAISPATGSVKGANVVIAGTNFVNVSAVAFGGVPAASYTVDSEGQITAAAPPSEQLASVPVTVTTPAGTATSATPFGYVGCAVPKLKHMKLKAAKRKLKKADCKVGHVKKLGDATVKTGRVKKQTPKPGTILAPGARVRLTLGT